MQFSRNRQEAMISIDSRRLLYSKIESTHVIYDFVKAPARLFLVNWNRQFVKNLTIFLTRTLSHDWNNKQLNFWGILFTCNYLLAQIY